MKTYKVHKVRIYPDTRQREYFHKAFGIKKFIWNHLTWRYKQKGEDGEYTKYSRQQSRDFYQEVKKTHDFLTEVSANVIATTIDHFDSAMKRYFSKISGKPRYKKRVSSFTIDYPSKFKIIGRNLFIERLNRLPRSLNGIKMGEKLRFKGDLKQIIISVRAGKWYVSVLMEVDHNITRVPKGTIGVDMGVKNIAILSDGTTYESSNKLRKSLDKLARVQRILSRKVRGSNGYYRQQIRVQKQHDRIVNQRNYLLHSVSKDITDNYRTICIEDLGVKDMVQDGDRNLSRMISDASFGELRRQIEYKAKLKGGLVVTVGKHFPSTKMCSGCGKLKKMKLSNRVYECPHCELVIDRDVNAAINIEREGLRISENPVTKVLHKFRGLVT